MAPTVARSDLEGTLFSFEGGPDEHYAKALPTSVVWHAFEPRALEEALPLVVRTVETDFSAGMHWIHYRGGIEPLDLLSIRELLQLGGALALWRTATIALDVCKQLEMLHDADLPQLLVHHGRVARAGTRFVLLPTLAGVLQPLSAALADVGDGWVHYVAPEVLRTRANQKPLLFAGDVYSFARTIEAWCVSSTGGSLHDPFEIAAARVERLDPDSFGEIPAALAPLRALVARMTAASADARPSLNEVRRTLEAIVNESSPAALFASLQTSGDRDAALGVYRELEEAEGRFSLDPRALRLMSADLALMESPPDCNRAVIELERAESQKMYEADTQLRMGRAYALWTSLPNHLTLTSEAYERAAGLSDWNGDVLDEWTAVLARSGDFTAMLAATADVPARRRTRALVELRTRALLSLGELAGAWSELSSAMPLFPNDGRLLDLGSELARLLMERR